MFVGLIILPVRLNKWSRGYNVAIAHPREEEWSNIPQEMAGEPDVEKPSIISRQAIYGAGNFVISEFWYKGLDVVTRPENSMKHLLIFRHHLPTTGDIITRTSYLTLCRCTLALGL